jgi:hypothetical protein
MHAVRLWVKRLPAFGLVLALVSGAVGGTTSFAQAGSVAVDCDSAMHFEIANPVPGSRVNPGSYVVSGVAVDARAEDDSPGIDTIDFFLGSRDAGGVIVGHAAPASVDGLVPNSFQATINLPRTTGSQELFGYAHSSVTGEVGVVSVPIALGVDVNKAGDVLTRTPVAECRVGSVDSGAAPSTDEQAQAALEDMAPEGQSDGGSDMGVPDTSRMYLDVGNPSPGDSVHVGAYTLEGIAFDGAADSGPGIDHIDIFVDDRDAGGTLVGHATLGAPSPQPDDPNLAGAGWQAQIVIPNKLIGPHSLFVYALSGATGGEMTVSIPVRVVP